MTKTIGTFGRQWEADLAIALLRENGLHPADLRTTAHATFAGGESAYYVAVPEDEAREAISLLKAQGYGRNVATGL